MGRRCARLGPLLEVGGNAFDTAFVYGGGRHEQAVGDWINKRGVAKDIVVTVKGAHTPHCTPEKIGEQFAQSMERLQLDFAPIYIMHRDNPAVPVGEFVEALNALKAKGLIGMFGGSNWSVARFAAARAMPSGRGWNRSPSLTTTCRWPSWKSPCGRAA